jgi:hypothetical protein
LPFNRQYETLTIGSRIEVRCQTESSSLKGPRLKFVRQVVDKAIGAGEPFVHPVLTLLDRMPEQSNISAVICNEPDMVDELLRLTNEPIPIQPLAKSGFSSDWKEELLGYAEGLDRVYVPLNEISGSHLLIEDCQTLTAIDVNSGGAAMRDEQERLSFSSSAIETILEQLKMRNLSGQIVIDFPTFELKKHRQELTAKMEQALQLLPNRIEVLPVNSLGLMCMTLERLYPAFSESRVLESETQL